MRQCKRGITLVELLTVIVILAVLMAILLPAFGLVREQARQSTCLNNQKQISLAILTYETDKQHLPYYVSASQSSNNKTYNYNWVEAIMPDIGHNDIWQQVTTGATPTATVEIMICPDDSYLKANPMQCAMSYVVNNQYLYLPLQAGKQPVYSGFLNNLVPPAKNFQGTVVPQTTISKMVSPSNTAMLSENVNGAPHLPGPWNTQITAASYPALTFNGPTASPAPATSTVVNSPHGSVVIMSFFDGHQQKVTIDSLFPTP